MSISTGSRASWDDIKQMYSNFNSGDGTPEGQWKVTDFGGSVQPIPEKPARIENTSVSLLNAFVQSIRNNRFVSSILFNPVPTPEKLTKITPLEMGTLFTQIFQVNHTCPFDASNYSNYFGSNVSGYNGSSYNSSNISGYKGSSYNGSGYNSSNVSGYNGSSYNSSNVSSHNSTHKSSGHNSSNVSGHKSTYHNAFFSGWYGTFFSSHCGTFHSSFF